MTLPNGTAAERWCVITVSYNSARTLERCWTAPVRNYEWIVVDNNSTDDSAEVAERLGARVIRLPENIGFGKANNIAVRATDRPYLLFANPDLEVVEDGLAALAGQLDRDGGLVAPQLLNPDGSVQPNGRGFPYVTAKLGNRKLWPFSRIHDGYRIVAGPDEACWVAWFIGAAVGVRRTDFEAIGGWNERFFIYYEDAEICLRAWRHGQPVVVLGSVRWVHHWSRATNTLRWSKAHSLEIVAARIFYRMFPEFVLGVPSVRSRHQLAAERNGKITHRA